MKKILPILLLSFSFCCIAQELDPLIDYRMGETVIRNDSGDTLRSKQVLTRFKQLYPCPSTGKTSGKCPNWAIDHVIPLDCGGKDAVYNLQWLPNSIKSSAGSDKKDHFERRIYGGHGISVGCP